MRWKLGIWRILRFEKPDAILKLYFIVTLFVEFTKHCGMALFVATVD